MENNVLKQIKPTGKWYLLSILIFLLGPLLGAYLLYSLFTAPTHTITFSLPGNTHFYIPKAGEYSLWTAANNTFVREAIKHDLPNFQLKFKDLSNGAETLFPPKIGWEKQKKNSYDISLGTLQFNKKGYYQVSALGKPSLHYKIDLRHPSFLSAVRNLALAVLFTIISVVLGTLSAIIILIKRINVRNKMQTNTPQLEPMNETPTSQATSWAMICHLSGFAGFLFPLANIIAPLIIWGLKRQAFPYLDEQGKEAINFQISVTLYYLISAIMIIILIGLFLLPLIAAFHIVAMIIASVETAHGKPFRYPLTIRFVQ